MKKFLFAIDLDGTLLSDSKNSIIHKDNIVAIKKLQKQGHIVTLLTGRPWRSTQKIYEELNLKTIVVNYNGAQIHDPSNYDFNPVISYMNLNDVMYVLGDKKLKNSISNIAIEGPGWVMIEKRNKDLESVFGFKNAKKLKVGINIHKLPLKPTGVVLDTKENIDVIKLKEYLSRKYGDLVTFSLWSKGENTTPVFDMTNVGVSKGKAISLIARYYNIKIENTIAIGDNFNDISMFFTTEYSIAMKNGSKEIQKHADYVTNKTNKQGGVAEFINFFLKDANFLKKIKSKKLS